MVGEGCLKNPIPAEWVHELYDIISQNATCRRQGWDWSRKMSQYNEKAYVTISARKGLSTGYCQMHNTGVQKRIQREHQNHCHPQVTAGCLYSKPPPIRQCVLCPRNLSNPELAREKKPRRVVQRQEGQVFPLILSLLPVLSKSGNPLSFTWV